MRVNFVRIHIVFIIINSDRSTKHITVKCNHLCLVLGNGHTCVCVTINKCFVINNLYLVSISIPSSNIIASKQKKESNNYTSWQFVVSYVMLLQNRSPYFNKSLDNIVNLSLFRYISTPNIDCLYTMVQC